MCFGTIFGIHVCRNGFVLVQVWASGNFRGLGPVGPNMWLQDVCPTICEFSWLWLLFLFLFLLWLLLFFIVVVVVPFFPWNRNFCHFVFL